MDFEVVESVSLGTSLKEAKIPKVGGRQLFDDHVKCRSAGRPVVTWSLSSRIGFAYYAPSVSPGP
jgi:hypothetical protein